MAVFLLYSLGHTRIYNIYNNLLQKPKKVLTLYLKRVKFGDIELDTTLELGEYRELTEEEIKLFKQEK